MRTSAGRSFTGRRAVLLALLCAACSPSYSREAALVSDFFEQARLQDTAALSNIARVTLNPRTEGTVQRFTVTNIGKRRLEGSLTREDVTVDAEVHTPEGLDQARTLVFTLEQAAGGRWVIAAVK